MRKAVVSAILAVLFLPLSAIAELPVVSAQFSREGIRRGPVYELEAAATEQSRINGLMYRKELPEHGGMIFVYGSDGVRHFWMKNTPLSLDLVFLDSKGTVQGVIAGAKPFSTSAFSLDEVTQSRYVIEFAAGTAGSDGIEKGDRLIFDDPLPRPEEGL